MLKENSDNELVNAPWTDDTWSGCETLIKAFEQAWRAGENPTIEDFLRGEGSEHHALLIELAHVDLELRLKAGEVAKVESYFHRYPALFSDRSAAIELIASEFLLRLRRGDITDVAEYASRFPAFSDLLARRLENVRDTKLSTRPKEKSPMLPPIVPGYDIVAQIGRGGMGVIYQAFETRLGRNVAMKFLPIELTGDDTLLQRFRREAKTTSGLNHPHICTIHALGEHDGRPYIVMEYVDGQTLRLLSRRGVDVGEVAGWIKQVASALAVAHAAGVVHRDIKPENIMVRSDGYVKVLDFGLARRLPTLDAQGESHNLDTWPGAVLGTIAYMSPEQARGEPASPASDVFSLGTVFYELLTGQHPFEMESAFETLHAIVHQSAVSATQFNPLVPATVERLLEAMMNKVPNLRPTAEEIKSALNVETMRERSPRRVSRPRIVHREPELAVLRRAFERAESGEGGVICVAGEPGIGKTTLVEDFLDELAEGGVLHIGRGRCSERQVGTAAFLPVVDALAEMLRSEASASIARLLPSVAPTWRRLLALSGSDDPTCAQAFTQQGILREFHRLLEEISRFGVSVLFFDDVHWADASTVDLLAYFGRHCGELRTLITATYRPTELLIGPHPFHRVKLDLQGRGVCADIGMKFLGRDEIERYLELVFPANDFPGDFCNLLLSRTEGNPLFMVDLLRYLREQGVIAESNGRWSLARMPADMWNELPESVRSMIQRKLDGLEDADRRLLAVAAAQGAEFDSTVVAGAMSRDPADVEDRLQVLDQVHGIVRMQREIEFQNRTPALRFSFVHVLYQQALFAELTPSRRTSTSKALASTLERLHGNDGGAVASELACLFETGREFPRAAHYFHLAALNAASVFAHQDAVTLARRGIGLLASIPPSHDRDSLELGLQTTLGLQLQVTEGYAASAAEEAYIRARELCTAFPQERFFPVLWGLWLVYKVRSELPRADIVARELSAIAGLLKDADLALQSHQALGLTALCRGKPAVAQTHVEQVAANYDFERHRKHAFLFGQDPGVICNAFGAVSLWMLGFPEMALRRCLDAIENSRQMSPNSQAVATYFAAMLHQMCRLDSHAGEFANAVMETASENGFSFWLAGGRVMSGWSRAACGSPELGFAAMRQGLSDWQATGSVTYITYYLGLLADALCRQGQYDEALEVLTNAFAYVEQTDERFYEPELWRLRGELILLMSRENSRKVSEAVNCFARAIEIAQRQEARSLELRSTLSLARMELRSGMPDDGLRKLSRILNTFTEGYDTPDLREARSLLENSR